MGVAIFARAFGSEFTKLAFFPVSGSSWYAAVFLIINAALGAGLLNFPQAFDRAGGITVALSVQAVSDVTNIHVAVFVTN